MLRKLLIPVSTIVLLSSCAGSYKTINPAGLNYASRSQTQGAEYGVINSVLSETGNRKYANRELKRPVKIYAVEFTNKTDRPISFRDDVKVFMSGKPALLLETSVIHSALKQPAGLYMLWSLLWVFIYNCDTDDCSVTPLPVGLIIGIGNTSVASSANKKLNEELTLNNLLDKTIQPGETVRGLIGLSGTVAGPLHFEVR